MDKGILDKFKFNRLAEKMRNGDERAAQTLYKELIDKVYGFCLSRVREKAAAEDLTQDIFVKLIGKIGTFDKKRGNFLGWFWQLVRNTLTDYYRSGGRNVLSFSEFPEEAKIEEVASYDIRDQLQQKIECINLSELIRTFAADEQELFEFRFVAELPYEEISNIIGKSEGTLRVAANRLKSKIKNSFKI
ncbi:MAG: RNA polymerase sigma factor [Patescibacteria group bacterium]|nr:RNA polymerase sigma factor [Patescibacteria group bacterium]